MRLAGKVAIITGAGSGIGRASALAFAREGARVVAADINEETCRATVEAIKERGGRAVAVRVDVTKAADCQRMVNTALEHFGKLDVLFNNAGINHAARLHETLEEDWDRVLAVNLKSIFLCSKYAIPALIQNGGGSIINTASPAGLVGLRGLAAYCASKGGVISLSKNMALDYAPYNIRVNYICPGVIYTPMTQAIIATHEDPQKFEEEYSKMRPLGRFGKPEEIANAAVFLASDESSFMTGASIVMDGGFTAG
ncbi:Dihydroanticapsin 7-dehydrogenase [Neomoorella glycerini]|uniref:Dihydroanticapsin 7-dehydrogenase n=1 Tax=Neomoorella glycerini TaxID=55779 RepID=A0A6I5ZTP8_9FIRM|nr:SDR family oxidoreductase [Moorella glycerini]QGP93126.1 Dihydroanticapsin 7-dehydrogenase [Moorella glycerini]